jgi:hypothetical protein
MHKTSTAALALVSLLLGGCAGTALELPDNALPGVYTSTDIADDFRCGELLFPHGCVVVRIPHVDSGCSPELGGYVTCNATIEWSAQSGAALPGSRLSVVVDGEEGPSCEPMPGSSCTVSGILHRTQDFGQPGQEGTWSIVIEATLTAPGEAPATTGSFTLALEMGIRTEGPEAITS